MTAEPAFTDLAAEQAVIGAALIRVDALDAVARELSPADFASPMLGDTFAAMIRLRLRGDAVDVLTTAAEVRAGGGDWAQLGHDLESLANGCPNPAHAMTYGAQVLAAASRRALRRIANEITSGAGDPTVKPADCADSAAAALARLDSPALIRDPGDVAVADFVAQEDHHNAPAVVPGLLDLDDRAVIVSTEGAGKSALLRQIATTVAHGIHPFTFRAIAAQPTLLVDFENGANLIRTHLRRLAEQGARSATGEREVMSLWHRPGGIDLRSRTDRAAFEDVLRRRRPALVAGGPIYKMYARRANESDESVASEMQVILDDLRTRYSFALILEHHAPQAHAGIRDLRPQGSSLWLRWPEYGLKLKPDQPQRPNVLEVGRFRGDRGDGNWPDSLHRDTTWPWSGVWESGVPW